LCADDPAMLEPSHAERARTLLAGSRTAALATLTSDFFPLVTTVEFIVDGAGNPVMVLPNLEPHVANAFRDPNAGLMVGGCLSLLGRLDAVPGVQQLELQDRYVAVHPGSARCVESLDWAWLRMDVHSVRFTDHGPWLELEDYRNAEPDPIAPFASGLIDTVNIELGHDLLLLARSVGSRPHASAVRLETMDRYGLDIIVTEPRGDRAGRIPFGERIDDPDEVVMRLAFEAAVAAERHRVTATSTTSA
jgi:heme iron utilization protein